MTNLCQFKRAGAGGGHNGFFQKNSNLSNLKLIFFQSNVEGFKQFCNSVTFL